MATCDPKRSSAQLLFANAGSEMSMKSIRKLSDDVFKTVKFQRIIPNVIVVAQDCGDFDETLSDIIASALKTMTFDFWAQYKPLNASSKKALVFSLVDKVIKTMPKDDEEDEEI